MFSLTATDLADYWPIYLVSMFLIGLSIDFGMRFPFRAWRRLNCLKHLARIIRRRDSMTLRGTGDLCVPLAVVPAEQDPIFHELWEEYVKTLHGQREVNDRGQQVVWRWRATVMAEVFFTERALVNSPLRTEYFKHLPGILTGLGIIGTFSGLIRGLSHFAVSLDPTETQANLAALTSAVGHAFYFSAAAISLAILFTCIEKLLLSDCYAWVEKIQHAVDHLFEAGAGEEYLERLVRASEMSATQALHIKEALVADLKQILQEVTFNQFESSSNGPHQMSGSVGKEIAQALGEPIQLLSQAVDRVGSRQETAINTTLIDVLAHLSEQVKEIFGGERQEIGELLLAIKAGADSLHQVAVELGTAGEEAAEVQGALNSQMEAFVERIAGHLAQHQTETVERQQIAASELGDHILHIIGQIQEQNRSSLELQKEASNLLADQTRGMVNDLSQQVEMLIRQSGETTRALEAAATALTEVAHGPIKELSSGAEALNDTMRDFAATGRSLTASIKGTTVANTTIEASSQLLGGATTAAVEILSEYKSSRDVFAMMVSDLKDTIHNASREASMTAGLVERLDAAASRLAEGGDHSAKYLEGINEILAEAHRSFAQNLETTLSHANIRFHEELSRAVGLLSGGIQELEAVFERVPTVR